MKTAWTGGLDEQRAAEIKADFAHSVYVRRRLQEICETRIKASRGKSITTEAYDNPNWNLKQADLVGYERALNEIISLIS